MNAPTIRTRLLQISLVGLIVFALVVAAGRLLEMHELGWPFYVRRWCTVAASTIVVIGAVAALRNRTWGLLLLVLSSVSFAGAWVFDIAPAWFVSMTVGGFAALCLAAAPLVRRDTLAFVVVTGLVLALGTCAAALAGPGFELANATLFTR